MTTLMKRRNDGLTETKPKLLVLIGTAYHALAYWLSMFPKAILLILDVPAELEKLSFSSAQRERVFLLPTGERQTLQQLIKEHGTTEQVVALKNLPNVSSNDGHAQLAAGGKAAMRQLLNRSSTKRLFDSLFSRLTVLSGGNVPELDIAAYTSMAGGAGSLGSVEVVDELIEHFLIETDVPIDVSIHALGFVTFSGPEFVRTQLNAGSALTHWFDRCRNPVHPRVTMSFYGYEAFPVGDDRQLRDKLLLDHQGSLVAPEVKTQFTQDRSNRGANGPVGNMCVMGTDHYPDIPSPKRIPQALAWSS